MTLLIWPQGTVERFTSRGEAARDFERLYPDAHYVRTGNDRSSPFVVRACHEDWQHSSLGREPVALMVEILPHKEE